MTTPPHAPAQSLARGVAGTALLHIERAHTGAQSWRAVHTWIQAATRDDISAADDAGLYFGAPAISFILHAAQIGHARRYDTAAIDGSVTRLAERRLAHATARVDRGAAATFAEYDVFNGLTGIAALLIRYIPDADVLPSILSHLVRLTQSADDGLPGWWVGHDPGPASPTPGGHANFGMAHGIAGVLALLSIASRDGIAVDGQADAIQRVCDWLDQWRQDGETGPWWPQWITRSELETGHVQQKEPLRPSWCYSTPGIARALQLAGIALHDTARQHMAEHAMAACLADPTQLGHLTEPGLCHGVAGVYQTAWHASRDALGPGITARLPGLAILLNKHDVAERYYDGSLLDGSAGLALAVHTSAYNTPPHSGWDTCLLIT
ncbi:lanthionine synthetase C family protein [Nonomuraea sp. NPDC048892]|uniref:lanthionine synthetase C family protein n=1 Tax=Nonomuraea sp. NPDC048892 TaxID=3154624 RepID=UPI0033FBDD76